MSFRSSMQDIKFWHNRLLPRQNLRIKYFAYHLQNVDLHLSFNNNLHSQLAPNFLISHVSMKVHKTVLCYVTFQGLQYYEEKQVMQVCDIHVLEAKMFVVSVGGIYVECIEHNNYIITTYGGRWTTWVASTTVRSRDEVCSQLVCGEGWSDLNQSCWYFDTLSRHSECILRALLIILHLKTIQTITQFTCSSWIK